MLFEKNDVILLNEIVYKIYSIEKSDEMRTVFLNLLKQLIPYNIATFYMASNQPGHLLCRPIGVNILEEYLYLYLDEFESIDYTRWIFLSGKSMAYKETDLFSDAVRENAPYYKTFYQPGDVHFSAQLSIAYHDIFLGIVSLYRKKEEGDFSDRDIFILDLLKDHLSFRLHYHASATQIESAVDRKRAYFDSSACVSKYHLTAREIEVLSLLYGGLSNDKICQVLCISPHTLKKHTLSIYKKLGINSRWEIFNITL